MNILRSAAPWLTLFLLSLLAYGNTFSCEFVFDSKQILKDGSILSWGNYWQSFPGLRFFVRLSYRICYSISGESTWSYHVFNLAVHVVNGWLLFFLTKATLQRISRPQVESAESDLLSNNDPRPLSNRNDWVAWGTAAIWLCHPIQTQAVTYVCQRAESLYAMFSFLTLACFVIGRKRSPVLWLTLSCFACWLGIGSKLVIVTTPILVLAYDRIFWSSGFRSLIRDRWHYYLGLFSTWIWIGSQIQQTKSQMETAGVLNVEGMGRWEYLCSQSEVILHYVGLWILPIGQCIDYGWQKVDSIQDVWWQFLILTAAFLACLYLLWKKPRWGFLLLVFFVVLGPTSSVIPIVDLAMEHRMYLASTTLAFVTSWIVFHAAGLWNNLFAKVRSIQNKEIQSSFPSGSVVVLGGYVILLCAVTYIRNGVYQTEESLWQDVIAKAPHHWRGYYNLAVAVEETDSKLAINLYQQAIEAEPRSTNSMVNLALQLADQKQTQAALTWLQRAATNEPDDAGVYSSMGVVLDDAGFQTKAAAAYEKSLSLDPKHLQTLRNFSLLLLQMDQLERAKTLVKESLDLYPDDAVLHVHAGMLNKVLGNTRNAEDEFRLALRLDPASFEAHYNLGTLYFQSDPEKSEKHLRSAIALNPDSSSSAHNNLGVLLEESRPREAALHYQAALKQDPNNVQAARNLSAIRDRL